MEIKQEKNTEKKKKHLEHFIYEYMNVLISCIVRNQVKLLQRNISLHLEKNSLKYQNRKNSKVTYLSQFQISF